MAPCKAPQTTVHYYDVLRSDRYISSHGLEPSTPFLDRGFVQDYLSIDKNLMRPAEVNTLLADSSKAKKILKWEPEVSFDDLVKGRVESDLELVTNHGY